MSNKNLDEIYQKYLAMEYNKKVVEQFYDNLNQENWDEIIKLFHDDYFTPVPGFIIPDVQKLKNNDRQFAEAFYEENHQKLTELGKELNLSYVWPPTNKKEMLDIMKLEAQFEKAKSKIFHLHAEGNIVLVIRSYELIEVVSQTRMNRIVHDRFLIEDGKIRQTESYHNYLGTLMQLGRIISQENDQEKVENYLDNLKKLGIL